MDNEIVTAEPFLLLEKTPGFRPHNFPSALPQGTAGGCFYSVTVIRLPLVRPKISGK